MILLTVLMFLNVYWILPIVFVVFMVLIERKILSYIQSRKSPEVNSIFSSSQTLKDSVKLLSKKVVLS